MESIFFHERVGGSWGSIIGSAPIPDLGPDLHLTAKVEGSRVTFTVSDGTQEVTTSHTIRHIQEVLLLELLTLLAL